MTAEPDPTPGIPPATPGAPPPGGPSATGRGARLSFLREGAVVRLVGVTGAAGVAGAMVSTSASLFLADEVGATPLMIGLFFAGRAVGEIAVDLVVGVLSDRVRDRRRLLALCALLSAAGGFSYSGLRDYYLLLVAGVCCFGVGSTSFAQLFAYSRQLADTRGQGAAFFTGFLRSVTSLSWVVGPPLAFTLIARQGFTAMYLTAAALSLAASALSRWGLPPASRPEPADGTARGEAAASAPAPAASTVPSRNPFAGLDRGTAALLAAVVLLLTANMMYQINLALFVTRDLALGQGFVGVLLGLAAALEIPALVWVGARSERLGKRRLVVAASALATVFFCLLPLASGRAALLLLQIPNALWTAVVLSVPVVILQDRLPSRLGVASSLYSSAFKTGTLLGGLVTGTVATWTGYTQVFWVCAALTGLASVLLAARVGGARAAG
ncbi:MFS transporter [Streptomyces liangshanensis]|uniref:MFS transporter n=1 Tax=Streptomyces liangshanensis TaxID=2717324 RepID=A0A6G9GVQ4_9ACTN|nr:MFS transporter [Streptomyces liangshanensis]QIQ02156.1 MFS transporter [Streptomyces liangshanensis]